MKINDHKAHVNTQHSLIVLLCSLKYFLLFLKLIYPLLSTSLSVSCQLNFQAADRKSLIFPHQSYTYLPLHSVIRVRHLCCFLKANSFPSDLCHSPSPSCSWLLFLKFLFLSLCFVYFSFSTSLFSWALLLSIFKRIFHWPVILLCLQDHFFTLYHRKTWKSCLHLLSSFLNYYLFLIF